MGYRAFSEAHEVSSILVVDMLPEGERGTARRLEEHLGGQHGRGQSDLTTSLLRLDSKFEFFNEMMKLAGRCSKGGGIPILHIEAHGSPIGLECPDGGVIKWCEIAEAITPINQASGHNLIVVMSTCYGYYLGQTLNIHSPAPFAILVAPNEEVKVAEIELPTENFYSDLAENLRLTDATDRHLSTHQYLSSLGFFCRYWIKAYDRLYQSRQRSQFREDTLTYILELVPDASKKLARKKIRDNFEPAFTDLFDDAQDIFFHGVKPLSISHLREMIRL